MPVPTPPPSAPAPLGRTLLWPAAGAIFVGVGIVVYRIATLPESRLAAFALGGGIALIIAGVVLGLAALSIRRRMSAAAAAFPRALLVPVTVGPATATPFRWLATATASAALRLSPSGYATIAFDADGLHLVEVGARTVRRHPGHVDHDEGREHDDARGTLDGDHRDHRRGR